MLTPRKYSDILRVSRESPLTPPNKKMKTTLRNKTTVSAKNETRTLTAKKEGRTWKGQIEIKGNGHSETRIINYTNGTLECELAAFIWTTLEVA